MLDCFEDFIHARLLRAKENVNVRGLILVLLIILLREKLLKEAQHNGGVKVAVNVTPAFHLHIVKDFRQKMFNSFVASASLMRLRVLRGGWRSHIALRGSDK